MLFKLIKTAISLIFASICLIPALSEEAINIGNYPCIGLSIDTVDGVGILSDSNDEKGAGLGLFCDIGHFDANKTSYPFDKYNIIYKYTGVFEYTTANGSFNTVPKFEAVYSVGNY